MAAIGHLLLKPDALTALARGHGSNAAAVLHELCMHVWVGGARVELASVGLEHDRHDDGLF